jgi:hypothetical protein
MLPSFEKTLFLLIYRVSPTNWGTAAILTPYVVAFKKNLQESCNQHIRK